MRGRSLRPGCKGFKGGSFGVKNENALSATSLRPCQCCSMQNREITSRSALTDLRSASLLRSALCIWSFLFPAPASEPAASTALHLACLSLNTVERRDAYPHRDEIKMPSGDRSCKVWARDPQAGDGASGTQFYEQQARD